MARIIIANSALADTKRIYGATVALSGKRNNSSSPIPGGTDIVETHTQSFENPKLSLQNINFVDAEDSLKIEDIYTLYKQKYSGSNPTTITIEYGDSTVVPNIAAETTGISCVLESYTINLSSKNIKDASIPMGTLTFVETK